MAPTTTSTTRTKCFSTMAFPFILIAITSSSFSYICFAERTNTLHDAVRTHRQLTDRHGNFLKQREGITKSGVIETSTSLGRNMPTDVKHHTDDDDGYGERDKRGRIGRQVGNRKAWLDRYKEMLNKWEEHEDDEVSNRNEENDYIENPSTPTIKETYIIPDSNQVSFLISGGQDNYTPVGGRNNGNLEHTLSDHKLIEGLQRLMTSTTRSTTRKYYRSTFLSPVRETTPSYYRVPVTTTTTTTTTTRKTTTKKTTVKPVLYNHGIDNKASVTLPPSNVAIPTKSSSALSSILESSNVDSAAAAAAVLVGGGTAAFLTSLLGSFLPSFDSSKEIDKENTEENQLIDRITTYTKHNNYPPQRSTSPPRPIRRRKPNVKRPRNPSRHHKRKPPLKRRVENNPKRYQGVQQQLNINSERNDGLKMSTSRIPSIPLRVLPVASVQTGYAQVIKQQQNDNENIDNLSDKLYPIKPDDTNNGYNLPSQEPYETLFEQEEETAAKERYPVDPKSQREQIVHTVSRGIINMFCREAVQLSEEKLRNELMTEDSFSYRLSKLIEKYNIPFSPEFLNQITRRMVDEDRKEASAKQALIVFMLDKTCNKQTMETNEHGYEDPRDKTENSSPNRIFFLDQNKKDQYVVSSIYSETPEELDMHPNLQNANVPTFHKNNLRKKFPINSSKANKFKKTFDHADGEMDMPFLISEEAEKKTNDYPVEPTLEIITAHPNMQHLGNDFNSILAPDANAPASAVVVTSGFSFDKHGRPQRIDVKPITPLRPGSVSDANDYKHLDKLPRRSDDPRDQQFESVVQLITSSLKARSGNVMNDDSKEEDYRDTRSPQRATHLKDILDANLKRNLQQGALYRQTFDQRQAPRKNNNIQRKHGHFTRQRLDGIQNLGKVNLPPRRPQQRRQPSVPSRQSQNQQRYYRQHYHHQQLGLPWPNRTDPVSAFTLHHQTSSTRPIPKKSDIFEEIGITLSTVYPTTTPSRLYTQFDSLDAVKVQRQTEPTPISSYNIAYEDSREEAEEKDNFNTNHNPDWNRPKRGKEFVAVSSNEDPSSVEYVYNVTFTAPEQEDSLETFDTNLALLEIDENDEFNDSYVDDLISDYYFPIIDLTINDDEPNTKIKSENTKDSFLKNKLLGSKHRISRNRTNHVKPEEVNISNHRSNRPFFSDSSNDAGFSLPQPGFRFSSGLEKPERTKSKQKILTNTRVTSIVTSKSTTYSVINRSTKRIVPATRRPIVTLRQSPITSTMNARRKNVNRGKSRDSHQDQTFLLNHRPDLTLSTERSPLNPRMRQRLTTNPVTTTTASTSKLPRLYYPQLEENDEIQTGEIDHFEIGQGFKKQSTSSIHSNMGQFIDHTPKNIIPLIREENTKNDGKFNTDDKYLGNENIFNHNINNHNRDQLGATTTTAAITTITSYFPSKTTVSQFYDDYTNDDDEFLAEEAGIIGTLNGNFFEDPTTNHLSNVESETVMNKDGKFITTESSNHNGKNTKLSSVPFDDTRNDNIEYNYNTNKKLKNDIFNPDTYAYTSPSPPSNTANGATDDVSLLDANSNLNDDYGSVRTKMTSQFNENQGSMTGQKEDSIKHDEFREQFTDTVHRTLNRNHHSSRHGAPTRWPASSNKVNVEGKHDKTPLTLEYEDKSEEYENYEGVYEDNLIDQDLKKKLLGKVLRNDRGPISDEEMLVMQVKSISNEGNNAEDLTKDKLQINPEKLAYILIGVCCGLSLLCLIVVAVSIGYKSETHYRLEDDSSALNTKDRRNKRPGAKNERRKVKGNISSSNFSSGCDDSTTSSHTTSDADEIDTEGQRSSGDDLSAMKLGPWFNGKNQTIDRKNMKFPTSVYLDRLEGSDQETKERRISTNSEEIIKSAAAEIDQHQSNTPPNNNTENNSLLSRDTLQSEDPNEVVDLDAITNANTLANEAKLPDKERKALIKNQNEHFSSTERSSNSNRLNKYSSVQDKISMINNAHHPHSSGSRREGTLEKKKKRRKQHRSSGEEVSKSNRRPYEHSSSDAATIYSHEGSFRFLNADEIESNKSSANESTTNTAISQALSSSSNRHRMSSHQRQKERDHQKIQWSDNDDRLI